MSRGHHFFFLFFLRKREREEREVGGSCCTCLHRIEVVRSLLLSSTIAASPQRLRGLSVRHTNHHAYVGSSGADGAERWCEDVRTRRTGSQPESRASSWLAKLGDARLREHLVERVVERRHRRLTVEVHQKLPRCGLR